MYTNISNTVAINIIHGWSFNGIDSDLIKVLDGLLIIKINKNKITIAPAYTISIISAKYSTFIINKITIFGKIANKKNPRLIIGLLCSTQKQKIAPISAIIILQLIAISVFVIKLDWLKILSVICVKKKL